MLSRRFAKSLIYCVLAAACGVMLCDTTHSGPYIFTNVVDSSGPFSSLGSASLNSNGTVVFRANLDDDTRGVFTASTGSITTIVDSTGPFNYFGEPAINDDGVVALVAGVTDPDTLAILSSGIYTGSGGPITTVADDSGPFDSFGFSAPSINNSGTVAFQAYLDTGGEGIFSETTGSMNTIADTNGPFDSLGDPTINNAGTVAFRGFLDGGGQGIYTRNGGAITTVLDSSGPFLAFDDPSINGSGVVAFLGYSDAFDQGIFTATSGSITTIADNSGPFDLFHFNTHSIDDGGNATFSASLDAGGGGIFTGDDPVAEKLIQPGDTLFGSTVVSVSIFGGLNARGDIVFSYELDNGLQGLAIATLVPEPTTLVLVLAVAPTLVARRRRR